MSQTNLQTDKYTLEYVKSLPEKKLYEYALKYLVLTASKRELNRAYRQLNHVKNQRRKYYYVRNDIYHPVHNKEGTIEKRCKRHPDEPTEGEQQGG
jgi:hypothetical protein